MLYCYNTYTLYFIHGRKSTMVGNQPIKYYKKPIFILVLILAVFFLKGVFLAELFPIFTGQDEARHYNSMQYANEPKSFEQEKIARLHIAKKETLDEYNFSQEIIEAGKAADFDIFRHQLYNTVNFSDSFQGHNETEINSMPWKPINYYNPPDTAGTKDLYHILGSKIEKFLSNSDILVRFFANRIFSVLLGTISILLAYFIVKNIGFRNKESLLITAIIAFQPKFAMYFTNINYDVLLIPLFFLFTLGGVLSLKNGPNWKNSLLMLISVILGILTKPTGLVLLIMLGLIVVWHIRNKFKERINPKKMALTIIGIIIITVAIINVKFKLTSFFFANQSTSISYLLTDYLSGSLTPGRLALAARTYWGALGWNNDSVSDNFTNFIWYLELIATVGIIYCFLSKKKFEYLPQKKYMLFLIAMVILLQLGIRFADYSVFVNTENFALGTPGRYFLPNLASHIILLFVGLGALLRKEKYFRNALITGLIIMFSFSMYLTFNVIIPRYYL